jgi:hypothetical protein
MITVHIGSEERDCPIDPNWVHKQINGLRKDGITPCIRVRIETPTIDFTLSSGCGGGGGMGRQFTSHEQEVFDLWQKARLGDSEGAGGRLVAFLKQLGCG